MRQRIAVEENGRDERARDQYRRQREDPRQLANPAARSDAGQRRVVERRIDQERSKRKVPDPPNDARYLLVSERQRAGAKQARESSDERPRHHTAECVGHRQCAVAQPAVDGELCQEKKSG